MAILGRSWNQPSEFLHRDKNKKKTLLWTKQTFFKLLIHYHNNVCTFLQALDVLFLFLMICLLINMTFKLCQVKVSKFYLMWILIYYNGRSSSIVLLIKADDLLSSGLFHFDLALIIFWVSDNETHTQMLSLFHGWKCNMGVALFPLSGDELTQVILTHLFFHVFAQKQG